MKLQSLSIRNFRSIKEQDIDNIGQALILVGKNNGGKSSLINAVRLLLGDYQIKPEDFHKDEQTVTIIGTFKVSESYLDNFVMDNKLGFLKIPSSANEFNGLKGGSIFEVLNFNEYKEQRDNCIENLNLNEVNEEVLNIINFWKLAICQKFNITNSTLVVRLVVDKSDLKIAYYDTNEAVIKDVNILLPTLAFIDDDRNFSEEQNAKAKTLTNELFGKHILKKTRTSGELTCDMCEENNCDGCLNEIEEKQVVDLSITDLEKLLRNKVDNQCEEISNVISSFFTKNYKDGYQIRLDPKSDVDSSFSLTTKVFDPHLNKRIDLGNVGAGVRSIYILSLLEAYHRVCNNGTVLFLIEEPEIYLHPSLQKSMGKILSNISQSNQVIFTTHSPLLLKDFEMQQIRQVKLNQSQETIVSETNLDEIISELGYSTEDILQTDFVIIVEGPDDKERIKNIINKFYNLDVEKIFIIDTKSCNNIEIYATLRFLNKTVIQDNFIIIRDSDTQEPTEIKRRLINRFRENLGEEIPENLEDRILVLEFSSLDNYFLDMEILKSLGIVRDEDDFYNKIDRYITSDREFICNYLHEKNDEERANELEGLIYSEESIVDRMDVLRKYVRGHNLFGVFGLLKRKTSQYIDLSSEEQFSEIIGFLDGVDYFFSNKIRYQDSLA